MAGRAQRRARRQARLQTQLRFGSEGSALRQLVREEDSALTSGLAFEDSAAAAIIGAALRASRPTKRAYGQSARMRNQAYERSESDLAGLSDAADPYRAGLARERALATALVGRERANALSSIQSRRVDARAGQTFNKRNLMAQHSANVGKVRLRQAELRRERGAFKAATYEDLLDDQRAFNLRQRSQAESERHNRESERMARQREQRQRQQATQRKGLTPAEKRARRKAKHEFRENVNEAKSWATQLKGSGYKWPEIRSLLIRGGEVEDDQGESISIGKIGSRAVDRAIRELRTSRGIALW